MLRPGTGALRPLFVATVLLATASSALADVHYVDVNSTNATPPYTSWATAATNIQDAVGVALAGDEVVVTDGTYVPVVITKPLSIRSVNGPQFTVINGNVGGYWFRCAYLSSGASLSGFTVTNGFRSYSSPPYGGGGVFCESLAAVVSNCVIAGCGVVGFYPEASAAGGGAYGGTLNNCMLVGNAALATCDGPTVTSGNGGGAAYCTLNNCTLIGNSVDFKLGTCTANVQLPTSGDFADGGGAYHCTLNNCTLTRNSATNHFTYSNYSPNDSGHYGDGGGAAYCTLNNCILTLNSARDSSGVNPALSHFGDYGEGGGAYACTLNNCTLTGNRVYELYHGGGAYACALNSSIVYFNRIFFGLGNGGEDDYALSSLDHCCTLLLPPVGLGNITNSPLFVDTNGWADLHLQSNSPCINAGSNSSLTNSYFTNCFDLDGNPRIVGGTVDIGAYEFQAPVSQISYAWLQQYGLPINSSTDSADPDGDGVDNYHEWLAHSDPTNSLSFPPLLTQILYGPNLILTWPTNALGFTLQSTTNLNPPIVWDTNSPAPVVIGNQNVVTNPLSGPQQFFRLKQ